MTPFSILPSSTSMLGDGYHDRGQPVLDNKLSIAHIGDSRVTGFAIMF